MFFDVFMILAITCLGFSTGSLLVERNKLKAIALFSLSIFCTWFSFFV